MSNKNRVVVIVGPTASGKTKLAVALAKAFGGEIISADSRQVYRGMDIGTGKDLAEYKFTIKNLEFRIPAHLVDVANPKRQFTVAQYQEKAYRAINDILKRDKLPIVCGGTGLYVSAVVEGFAFAQSQISNLESQILKKKLRRMSLKTLLTRLKKVDPKTYKVIDKKNRRRVERALELYYLTGKPKSQLAAKTKPPYDFLLLGINPHKEKLRGNISKRLRERMRQGLVAEVRRLHREGVSWRRLDGFGLEYRWVARYLQGMVTKAEMETILEREIWLYSKRQMTWFRRMSGIHWVNTLSDAKKLVATFCG